MTKNLLIVLLLLSGFSVKAGTDTLKQGYFNFVLVPPLSIHGISSKDKEFNFSLNAIGGYNGGIRGFEVGGLWNVDRNDMHGFQVAGLTNVVRDQAEGFQVAGLVNTARIVKGFQVSGLVSSSAVGFSGMQISGLVSYAQNLNTNNQDSTRPVFNSQISGLVSVGKNFDQNLQIAGLINQGDRITGSQMAGLINMSKAVKGTQLAGLINLNSEDVEGVQAAGLINIAHNIKGVQIGLINICDSVDGEVIGLVNFGKNIQNHWEVMVSDAMFANVRFTSGAKRFYSILTLGAKMTDEFYWGYGIGGGYLFNQKENSRNFVELNFYHITEKEIWNKYYSNGLYSFSYGWQWDTKNNQAFRIAPTVNMYLSKKEDDRDRALEKSKFPAYSIYSVDQKDEDTRADFWVGVNLAYRFR